MIIIKDSIKGKRPSYYRELFAQVTLKTVLPKEFFDIELSDKPDLISKTSKKGIEVVFATEQKEEQLNSYYQNYLCGKTIEEVSSTGLKNFRSHSYDVVFDNDTYIISAYKKDNEPFNINIIYQAIHKKIKKLNLGLYKYPDNISLYVQTFKYSGDYAAFSTAESILKYVNTIKEKYNFSFKEIFYDCILVLYRLNVDKNTIDVIELNDDCDKILECYNTIVNEECEYDQL